MVPWTLPSRLTELLRPPSELLAVTPDFVLPLIDLRRVDDEEIRRHVDDLEAVLALLSLKHIFDGVETLVRLLLREIWERKAPHAILKPEMNYMAGVYKITNSQEMKQIVDPIAREVGMAQDIVETWLDEYLQQGLQKGLEQGLQQGLQQGLEKGLEKGFQQGARLKEEQVIRTLLKKKTFSFEEIASLVGVELSRVREVAESPERGS